MDDKLNILTEKIYSEGITKAKIKADEILDQAKKEAQKIIEKAQEEANQLIAKSKTDSENLKRNVQSEVKLATHQALNQLKNDLASILLKGSIKTGIKSSIEDKEFWGQLILGLVKAWASKGELDSFEIILSPQDQAFIQDQLEKTLNLKLEDLPPIKPNPRLKGGFVVRSIKEGYSLSFSQEDFENFLQDFLRPTTIKLLYGNNE